MTEPKKRPVRLRLSRSKGFLLHAKSLEVNGLAAVRVDRTSPWGNPFRCIDDKQRPRIVRGSLFESYNDEANRLLGLKHGMDRRHVPDALVVLFRVHAIAALPSLEPLRGRNLACWCALDAPCHADVLLELANVGKLEPAS